MTSGVNTIGYYKPHLTSQTRAPRLEKNLYDLSRGGVVHAVKKKGHTAATIHCSQIGTWGNYYIVSADNPFGFYINDGNSGGQEIERVVSLPVEVTAEGMLSNDWAPLVLEIQ